MNFSGCLWTRAFEQLSRFSPTHNHHASHTPLVVLVVHYKYDTITPSEGMLEDYCHSISIWNEADRRIPGSVWQKAVTGVWTKSSLSDNFLREHSFQEIWDGDVPLYICCAFPVHLYITWPDGSSMLESPQKKRASLKSKQTKQQDMCNFLCMFHLTPLDQSSVSRENCVWVKTDETTRKQRSCICCPHCTIHVW